MEESPQFFTLEPLRSPDWTGFDPFADPRPVYRDENPIPRRPVMTIRDVYVPEAALAWLSTRRRARYEDSGLVWLHYGAAFRTTGLLQCALTAHWWSAARDLTRMGQPLGPLLAEAGAEVTFTLRGFAWEIPGRSGVDLVVDTAHVHDR